MEFSEQIMEVSATSAPLPLRRIHSLDIQAKHDDSSENDLDDDTDAAQMLEYLDDYGFLDNVTVDTENLMNGGTLTPIIPPKNSIVNVSKVSVEVNEDMVGKTNRGENTSVNKKPQTKSRRIQILELQKTVKALTSQLDTLKTDSPEELESRLSGQSSPLMWKNVALRQFKRRRSAEADNMRLREIVEMQVHEAKCLQRILKRRAKIQLMEDMLGMKRRKDDCNLVVPADNAQVFAKMIQELDESYWSMVSYLSNKRVDSFSCLGDEKMNSTAVTGVVFETTKSHLLPFSLGQINECSWAILKNLGTGDFKRIHGYFNKLVDLDIQHYEESHNTIAMSSFSPTPTIEDISGVLVRKVMRMYVEEDQTVFIWKILAEPKLEGSNLPAGFQVESTLQAVIRRNDTPILSGGESTQLLLHFIGSRLDLDVPISSRFRNRGQMEIAICLWEKLVSRKPSEIESEVVDLLFGISRQMVRSEQTLMVSI